MLAVPQPIFANNQVGVLRHFVTVPVAGLSSEGVANRGGSYFVSTIGFAATEGRIFVFDKKGDLIQTFTLPGLPIVGQAVFYKDSLFVVACSPGLAGGAVVRIDLNTGVVNQRFAADPTCPNGLTIDGHGNLYVANFAGAVDKVTQSGTVTLNWASGGLLIVGSLGGFIIGPNDITYNKDQNALYTTDTFTNTVVKIQIQDDGSAGVMTAYAKVPTPDGLVFDSKGNLYVASPFTNAIYLVTSQSTVSPMAFTGSETLDGPSALVFHGNDLYITNLNLASTYSSGYLSIVTLNFPGT